MFGLLKKSKPQQNVYFPFKTVFEKDQLIFDKKQFASNGFDIVQKQKKRQNRCDDEKLVRSRDRPFTKAKRSNCDVPDQNKLQTYASLEKMLHKAIHVVRQLKKKGNNNTSSAPKQQSNSSSISNSDLKTNVLSSDKSKAVKTTSKAFSTRCFKCHRIDQDVLDNLIEVRSSDRTGQNDRAVLRASRVELRLEPRPDDRFPRTEARLPRPTQYSKTHGRARLSLGGEETEDGHALSSGEPSGQSRKRPYLYLVHPSGSDESGHLDWSSPFSVP
uniref:Uncharacterized protein n=1 Tax=Brassica campestris TaxID=3711 RepID=A0A3P5XY05_BRACM|nr:unnamed protein product [Brassica rapa]